MQTGTHTSRPLGVAMLRVADDWIIGSNIDDQEPREKGGTE
jgi:hypothetical protein